MSAVTNAENAPHNMERREDGVIAEQERYLEQLNKMKQNESKLKQKSPTNFSLVLKSTQITTTTQRSHAKPIRVDQTKI
jgi:hypothetical protein